jgi:hypothetical protein
MEQQEGSTILRPSNAIGILIKSAWFKSNTLQKEHPTRGSIVSCKYF